MIKTLNETIDYLTKNKVDKISFWRHRLTYHHNGKQYSINTTNWTNTECHILIKELNKVYNKGYTKTTNNKLKELKVI